MAHKNLHEILAKDHDETIIIIKNSRTDSRDCIACGQILLYIFHSLTSHRKRKRKRDREGDLCMQTIVLYVCMYNKAGMKRRRNREFAWQLEDVYQY